jgi:hypothetical protein
VNSHGYIKRIEWRNSGGASDEEEDVPAGDFSS